MFRTILVPTDGSEASKRALNQAAGLARALGARLVLMTAIEPYPTGLSGAVYAAGDNPMHQAARDAAAHWLTQAQAQVSGTGMDIQTHVSEHVSVHQGILEAAKRFQADLIVMGTRGAGALERLIVGSQTQRVLAHTEIPTLLVH